jgi:hypothetical protein
MMDEQTLHEINSVMVDKIAIVYCMAMGLICSAHGVSYPEAMAVVGMVAANLDCVPRDVEAVSYAADQVSQDPTFLSKHKATEEQIVEAMWPNRRVVG